MTTLTFILLATFVSAAYTYEVEYIKADLNSDCATVCQNSELYCVDDFYRDMNCLEVAQQECGSSSFNRKNNAQHCDYGGCFVGCRTRVYSDKNLQRTSCSVNPNCDNGGTQYGFVQYCPCYRAETIVEYVNVDTTRPMSTSEFIGLVLALFSCTIICCVLGFYTCYAKRTKRDIYDGKGFMEYLDNSWDSCWEFIFSCFSRKKNNGAMELATSEHNAIDTSSRS